MNLQNLPKDFHNFSKVALQYLILQCSGGKKHLHVQENGTWTKNVVEMYQSIYQPPKESWRNGGSSRSHGKKMCDVSLV